MTAPGGRDAREPGSARAVMVTAALAFAVGVMALVQTTSIALLPTLPAVFGSSLATVSWVATSTLVVGAATNPIVGRMGDVYGKRRLVLGCLVAAAAGSVLGALAPSLGVVILARSLQGLGSGVIPLAYGILRDELHTAHLPRAVSVVTAAGAGLGAGLGPVTMGAIIESHGWRTVFWVTTGLLAAAGLGLAATTGARGPRFPARFDVAGAMVLATTLVTLLVAITKGSTWGWSSPSVLALGLAAAASATWWTRWERRRPDPLVDLTQLASGPVRLAHLAGVMVGFATFTQYISSFTLVSLPAATGHGLGRSLATAGLVQLPGAAVLVLAVLAAAPVGVRYGSILPLRVGAATIVAGFALAFLRHGTLAEIMASTVVVSAGLGASFCSLPVLILDNVEHGQTAAVNAVNALARVIGSVLASALVTSVMATGAVPVAGRSQPAEWTFLAAYAIGAVPALAVAALAGPLSGATRSRRRPLPLIHHEVMVDP